MAARNVGSSIGVTYCLKTTGCPNGRALNSPALKTTVTIQITSQRNRDARFITDFLIVLLPFMSFT